MVVCYLRGRRSSSGTYATVSRGRRGRSELSSIGLGLEGRGGEGGGVRKVQNISKNHQNTGFADRKKRKTEKENSPYGCWFLGREGLVYVCGVCVWCVYVCVWKGRKEPGPTCLEREGV